MRKRAPQSVLGLLPLDLFELALTKFIGTGYAASAYAAESAVATNRGGLARAAADGSKEGCTCQPTTTERKVPNTINRISSAHGVCGVAPAAAGEKCVFGARNS